MLFAFQEELEFSEEAVAERLETNDGLSGFVGAALGIEGKNVCATGMEILMQQFDFFESGCTGFKRANLGRHPRAEAALRGIEGRGHASLAMQKGFDGSDPGVVFSAGVEERTVSRIEHDHIGPLRIGSPRGKPGGKVCGGHGARDAITLGNLTTEAQEEDTRSTVSTPSAIA